VTDVTVTVLDPSTELRLHRLTGAFLAGYRNANGASTRWPASFSRARPVAAQPHQAAARPGGSGRVALVSALAWIAYQKKIRPIRSGILMSAIPIPIQPRISPAVARFAL
jgi:hypothetical protein